MANRQKDERPAHELYFFLKVLLYLRNAQEIEPRRIWSSEKGLKGIFPKVPFAYVLWQGDEEFPPQITDMFDSTIERHCSLDGIWCLEAEVSQRLFETKQK